MDSEKLDNIKLDIKHQQADVIKFIVKKTLETIAALEVEKNKIQEKIKVLKHDTYDLKDGRLDKILDRHAMSEIYSRISTFSVEKTQKTPVTNPWYVDYKITYTPDGKEQLTIILNNSVTKMHASGTYKLDDGSIKFL